LVSLSVAMFVYDFVTLERPYVLVAGALINDRGAGAMTRAVVAASAAGSDANTHVVRFEAGEARSVAGVVVVPIRWTAGPGRSPFHHLEGSLHVEPLEPDGSYLSLSASYDESPTGLGRREDTRRRQREAEIHVRMFLRELVDALQDGSDADDGNG
jgi:hypothetical protein